MSTLTLDEMYSLGERVCDVLDLPDPDYSLQSLANDIGIPLHALSAIINDRVYSSYYTVRIARYAGVCPYWLATGKGERRIDLGFLNSEEGTLLSSFRAMTESDQKTLIRIAKALASPD